MTFNEMVLVNAVMFNSGELDVNGMMPILLRGVSGTIPNRQVLSGTVASNEGFEPGRTYIAQIQEVEPSEEYGRQFRWQNLGEVRGLELIQSKKELGELKLFRVETNEEIDPNEQDAAAQPAQMDNADG